ncbi:hypothetical protein BDW68DRAFT_183488 [Aspergillus falconensis]
MVVDATIREENKKSESLSNLETDGEAGDIPFDEVVDAPRQQQAENNGRVTRIKKLKSDTVELQQENLRIKHRLEVMEGCFTESLTDREHLEERLDTQERHIRMLAGRLQEADDVMNCIKEMKVLQILPVRGSRGYQPDNGRR